MERDGIVHVIYFSGEAATGNIFYVKSRDYGQTSDLGRMLELPIEPLYFGGLTEIESLGAHVNCNGDRVPRGHNVTEEERPLSGGSYRGTEQGGLCENHGCKLLNADL